MTTTPEFPNATTFNRRQFIRLASALATLPAFDGKILAAVTTTLSKQLLGVPPGVAVILANTLNRDPATLNTDWFGTMLMHGLLLWSKRGVGGVEAFARSWLTHHLQSKTVSKYSGPRSRTIQVGGIAITTYAGHYGLAFPCYEMAKQFGDRRARQVCVDIAKAILHQASRNRFGLVGHDDHANFAIPDTCYFVAPPLMMASLLDRKHREVLQEQALYQLRAYIEVFLDKDRGLAKTILFENGLGNTYWTRATGWLLWAITGVLRHLPPSHPQFQGFREDLERLAAGISRVQHASGGFRVLLDDPSTPLESTGAAMCATGLHEAIRRGWLSRSFAQTAARAWEFVKGNITPDGQIIHAYTGWAVPAENREMSMDEHKMDWIPGLILYTANELL